MMFVIRCNQVLTQDLITIIGILNVPEVYSLTIIWWEKRVKMNLHITTFT